MKNSILRVCVYSPINWLVISWKLINFIIIYELLQPLNSLLELFYLLPILRFPFCWGNSREGQRGTLPNCRKRLKLETLQKWYFYWVLNKSVPKNPKQMLKILESSNRVLMSHSVFWKGLEKFYSILNESWNALNSLIVFKNRYSVSKSRKS